MNIYRYNCYLPIRAPERKVTMYSATYLANTEDEADKMVANEYPLCEIYLALVEPGVPRKLVGHNFPMHPNEAATRKATQSFKFPPMKARL